MWREKIIDYLLDISKYSFTAVVITAIMEDMSGYRWLVYGIGILITFIAFYVSMRLHRSIKNRK